MMNCDEWKAFAQDYVFGDLNVPARELLDRHAASCASCLGEASLLKRVDRGLRQQPAVEPPAGLWKRALEGAPASREIWRVAAALLIAGGIGAFSIRLPDELRRAPQFLSDAAQAIPSIFGAIHVP